MGCGASAVPVPAFSPAANLKEDSVQNAITEAAVSSSTPPPTTLPSNPLPPIKQSSYLLRRPGVKKEDDHAAVLRAKRALEQSIWSLAISAMEDVWPKCALNAFDDFSLLEDFSLGATHASNRMREALTAALTDLRPAQADEVLRPGLADDATFVTSLAQDADVWQAFARRCLDNMFLELFEVVCGGSEGKLRAQDVMIVLELLSQQQGGDEPLSYAETEQIVREFDVACDGVLSQEEFLGMVHTLEPDGEPVEHVPPHLLLHMDVNNTVLIADSVSNQSAVKLITLTISSYSWGTTTRGDSGKKRWVLVCKEPSMLPPWDGLTSYADFVTKQHPFPEKADYYVKEEVRKTRRALMHSFTDIGSPGESVRPLVDNLVQALQLPPDLVGTEAALNAGLNSDTVQLLPSFFHLLRDLKRQGRTFTLIFRSFGTDLGEHIQKELNALCEGHHPLFVDEPHVPLDGSDGLPDYRMDLTDKGSLGTFFRSPKDGDVSLIWGSHQQPKPGQGLEFYDDALLADCKAHEGVRAAAASLEERILSRSDKQTVVLRDYYPGWAKADFRGDGGKPIFLNVKDQEVLPIFFDDHLRPTNPTIVDAVDVETFPTRLPMPQVYNRHLARASPMRSIVDRNYFVDEVARLEREKVSQARLWRRVGRLLHDPAALAAVIDLLAPPEEEDADVVDDAAKTIVSDAAASTVAGSTGVSGLAIPAAPVAPEANFTPRGASKPSVILVADDGRIGVVTASPRQQDGLKRQVSTASKASGVGIVLRRAQSRGDGRATSKSELLSQNVGYTSWRESQEVKASQNFTFTDFEAQPGLAPIDRRPKEAAAQLLK